MDQDAFRNLLSGSQQSQLNGKRALPTTSNTAPQKAKAVSSSQPTFKPRKIKKVESKYRDRAAERRDGTGNDYAEVEAVLEDFERQVAHEDKDVVEQQRKYLGGDSQHTILVKGLDMSLLEQNLARAVAPAEDDEILEQAFTEATSAPRPAGPRKRTREDIIRDLKAKRQNGPDIPADQLVVAQSAEEESSDHQQTKKTGKFRPIGFKPIGQMEEKSKKRKTKDGKEAARKKKRKAESAPAQSATSVCVTEETPAISPEHDTTQSSSSKMQLKPLEQEPAPLDADLDIFAGAGDYEGFPVDVDSEEEPCDTEETRAGSTAQLTTSAAPVASIKGWFDELGPEARRASIPPEESPPIPEVIAVDEEPQEIRLIPLESSTLPSIRDFLAMDEAVEKAEKRKARKEKKKKKKKAGDDDDD